MADEKALKGIKSFLRSVLISSKDGVPAYNLQSKLSCVVALRTSLTAVEWSCWDGQLT